MGDTTRKPYLAKNYHDMMRHIYAKPKGHSEGRKPYMSDSYFEMEYPQLSNYGGGGEPTIDIPATEEPINECLQWFLETVKVSGKDYFGARAFYQNLVKNLPECTKLHTTILSCLQYNSLSFCICCASAMLQSGRPGSSCSQDFGSLADEDWDCCSNPCADFDIRIWRETAAERCYNIAESGCSVRVKWEMKTYPSNAFVPIDPNPCIIKGGCGRILRATDLCGNERTKDVPAELVVGISGSNTIVKSSSQQYTASCACGVGTIWSISGIGAIIDQTGLVTTDATACGMLSVSASIPGCGATGKTVRVTDGGVWSSIFSCGGPDTTGCIICNSAKCSHGTGLIIEDKRYKQDRACLSNIGGCPSQASWDTCYNSYIAAGGINCTLASCSGCYATAAFNMVIEQWVCP